MMSYMFILAIEQESHVWKVSKNFVDGILKIMYWSLNCWIVQIFRLLIKDTILF